MVITELINEAFAAITVNKVRSGLTILGIVIGIGSVIAMISIGQGAQGSINASIQSIGSNLLVVMPSFQRTPGATVRSARGSAQTLTLADYEAITQQITQAVAIAPEVTSRVQVVASGNNTNTQVDGTTPNYPSVRNYQIDIGSFFSDQNVTQASKVAVLGPTTRDDLFGAGVDPTGQIIRINNINFTVIGVTKAKGGNGFQSPDDIIFIPYTTAQHYLTGATYFNDISIQAPDQASMTAIQQQVTSLLLSQHKIADPTQADFNVLNQQDLANTASSVTSVFTTLLASIASISLVVGGIGIMNMMLTTVTERTREIGLRKAIGAKNKYISYQFLIESVMLTFIGGIIGVILGWILSLLVTQFAGITTSMSLQSVLLAFGVSAGIGIVFGYYPARRAAGLNPIEALRYE